MFRRLVARLLSRFADFELARVKEKLEIQNSRLASEAASALDEIDRQKRVIRSLEDGSHQLQMELQISRDKAVQFETSFKMASEEVKITQHEVRLLTDVLARDRERVASETATYIAAGAKATTSK